MRNPPLRAPACREHSVSSGVISTGILPAPDAELQLLFLWIPVHLVVVFNCQPAGNVPTVPGGSQFLCNRTLPPLV